jgi:hypothetical protein
MLRLNCLVATSILALTIGAANATVFDVSGSASLPLGGTITISGGSVTGVDVTSSASPIATPFTDLSSSVSSGGGTDWNITVDTATSPENYFILMVLPVASLASYAGGNISIAVLYDNVTGFEEPIVECGEPGGAVCGHLTAETSISPTPLPAALPLFATGLGAMGLFGWRRKRKAQAVAA